MKNHIYTAIILAFLLAIFSCSEEKVKTTTARPFIYYANYYYYSIEKWDTISTYNFFFYPDANDTILRIPVKTGGVIPDIDRTFLIEPVIIGEGVEGLDFELSREQIMPAKKELTYIPVKLMRRAEMEGKTFQIKIWLRKNENFSLDLPWAIDNMKDTIQRHYFIVQCQAELSAPLLWTSSLENLGGAGYWSTAKYHEMNKLWGTTMEDWIDKESKLSKNVNNYMITFANYLNQQASLGADHAIKDPAKASTRGYMSIKGFDYFGIQPTVIPADFPTTEEWEGN